MCTFKSFTLAEYIQNTINRNTAIWKYIPMAAEGVTANPRDEIVNAIQIIYSIVARCCEVR